MTFWSILRNLIKIGPLTVQLTPLHSVTVPA